MPMGFYQPAQNCDRCAKDGVTMLPVDINHSDWDNKLEVKDGKFYAHRLGFVRYLVWRQEDIVMLMAGRKMVILPCMSYGKQA